MRPLALKLTLGFLLVGIIGAVLVAVITSQRTQQAFDRFINNREQEEIVDLLADYYERTGGWDNLSRFIDNNRRLRPHLPRMVVVDTATDTVVVGLGPEADGRPYPYNNLNDGLPIEVNGQQVGLVLLEGSGAPPDTNRFAPEVAFLRTVTTSTILSATIAGVIALALGILLARTLTRPLQELTAATQVMAAGQLGHQVQVRSQDEIGQLARSFNQMSSDLAQASQVRKQMTADIAHDLRTPLTILRGYMEGLKDGALNGSPNLYNIMYEEVTLLQHLVEDLRTLSLADAGELSLNIRAVDPKALLERTGLAYVMEAEQRGLALRIDAADDLPSVMVDADRMTQVFNNLVSNALRFTTQGEIVLAAAATNQHLQFEVRDTGAGISPGELTHIFDRFYRADESRQRTEDGSSGLGLAIAKAIVEAHKGQITAVSTPGQGTTFTITFPLT
ncbi:MAG: HAMP domain-containing protein [Ardenticatenaceae bacterium]|nr:HAMP domain-containing protein [Ardenticatenaceae bacterium]